MKSTFIVGILILATVSLHAQGVEITAEPPDSINITRHAMPPSCFEDWANGVYEASQGNMDTALAYFIQSAGKGNGAAAFEVGSFALKGGHFKADYALARRWFLFAKSRGDMHAENTLDVMLYRGAGVPADPEKAIQKDSALALRGCWDAAWSLAMDYRLETGRQRDDLRQRYWLDLVNKFDAAAMVVCKNPVILAELGFRIDELTDKLDQVNRFFATLVPGSKTEPTPTHKVTNIEITKFTGHLLSTGLVNLGQPFEIECKVTTDPAFIVWPCRINYWFSEGRGWWYVSRLSAIQQSLYMQAEMQTKSYIGDDYTIGVHDLP